MKYQNLLTEQNGPIFIITINRQQKLNALNKVTLEEIHTAMMEALKNPTVQGIIFTGAGEKAFVAGADIAEFRGLTANEGRALSREAHNKVFDVIENSKKPVVAAINGYALGGGLELALAAHIRVASDRAKLGLPEVTLGLIPGYGGTQRLSRLTGKGRAMELILTAKMITAEEALQWGLVNVVCQQQELMDRSVQFMGEILRNSPGAISRAIYAINSAGSPSGFETEITEFGNCFDTEDFKEGVAAFLEKRDAKFSNR